MVDNDDAQALTDLHYSIGYEDRDGQIVKEQCAECDQPWPCDTIRSLAPVIGDRL